MMCSWSGSHHGEVGPDFSRPTNLPARNVFIPPSEDFEMMRLIFGETRKNWAGLNLYQRFEQIVVLLLSFLISIVIVVALFNVLKTVFGLLRLGLLDPARPEVFQAIFGMIMIVLISLEFNHTIVGLLERGRSIVQVRAVVLIALLAVLRKFIVIEIGETDALVLLALSAATLALGGVYWAVREQDRLSRTVVDDGAS
jgi:uncharacterized membrane protein (DUF373 family)